MCHMDESDQDRTCNVLDMGRTCSDHLSTFYDLLYVHVYTYRTQLNLK